jgi:hypothetical protein
VKWGGVAAGALLALLLVVVLWATAAIDPPETVSRGLAGMSALFPSTMRGAQVERIPCPPLKHLRLYVVCTSGCEDAWVIVAVRGLSPVNLANLGRIPPEPAEESRARIAAAVAREDLSLDRDGAREMIACYLRIEGRLPGLVMTPLDLVALEDARGSEEDMEQLAKSLNAEEPLSRIDPRASGNGYVADLFYWDTALPGRPVLEIACDMQRNGVLRTFDVKESIRGGSAPGNIPDRPPF